MTKPTEKELREALKLLDIGSAVSMKILNDAITELVELRKHKRIADDANWCLITQIWDIQKAIKPALRFMEHTMPPDIMKPILEVMGESSK